MRAESGTRLDVVVCSILVVVFCLVGLLTLDDYGLTFDETWHLFAGDRYFRFWMTFDSSLMDFSRSHPMDNQPEGHPAFDRLDDEPRPAVANTLSALGCWLFFVRLRWLDPVDAHHLPIVLMAGGTLAVVYALGREVIGRPAAIFATFALGLSPRFLAHAHFNVKDVPKTFFFSLTIWTFWKATCRRDWRWMLGSALFFGLALGTRVNAVLIPFVAVPWLVAVLMGRDARIHSPPRSWWASLCAYPVVASATWVLTWPLMLVAPLDTLKGFIGHWLWMGVGGHSLATWSPYGVMYIVVTTPPVVLFLGLLGAVVAGRDMLRDTRRGGLLLLLWAAVPVLRTALPRATNYDGIRQFIEFLPAFCLLAGLAAQRLLEALETSLRRSVPRVAQLILLGLAFVPVLFRVVQIHPYELVYFNALVGGLPGAQRLGIPQAMDYWGSSHRQGIAWLNANAEPGARLYISESNANMVLPVRDIWLREDITVLTSDSLGTGEPVYVAHITRPGFYDSLDRRCEEHLEPVYSIRVEGVPILKIFRLEGAHLRDAKMDEASG